MEGESPSLSNLIFSVVFLVVVVINFLQLSITVLLKFVFLMPVSYLFHMLKLCQIFLRKHVFVAVTLLLNQNYLILMHCCSNIFLRCKQQKSFWNHLNFFSRAYNVIYYIGARKMLQVIPKHKIALKVNAFSIYYTFVKHDKYF